MKVITRFAPSPTGLLHLGGARTALFNYLFARRNNGLFLVRIEDTDKSRSTKNAIDAIKNGLHWLGLNSDKDIIYQSHRIKRHKEIAEELIKNKFAYKCFLTNEEQSKIKSDCIKNGKPFRSPWRNKTENLNSNFVIRLKLPDQEETTINDEVQGEVKVSNSKLDDFVLIRSDGTPTYMLAVVVDDHDMKISHIIRGDDHLNNAFRQYWIYRSLNWEVPTFAHIPLIHGTDGSKLSKRHGAVGVDEYKNLGILPDALNSYLMNLGWTNLEKILNKKEASKIFVLKKLRKSPSRFDIDQLKNINAYYLKNENPELIISKILKYFNKENEENEIRLSKSIKPLLERSKTLTELIHSSEWIVNDDLKKPVNTQSINLTEEQRKILLSFQVDLKLLDVWNKEKLKEFLTRWLNNKKLKFKDIGPSLRFCLTGKGSSIDLIDILYILGPKEVYKRINSQIND